MREPKQSIWQIYSFALITCALIAALVGWRLGLASLITVLVLSGIEISFSFENAIINAKILQRLSRRWQHLFMTLGIVIAVFGVRFILPVIMVAITSHLSLHTVIDLAFNHPTQYAQHLGDAHAIIASFGGLFLLMIFLDFIFETRPILWLVAVERRLAKFGKLESLSVIVASVVLLLASQVLAARQQRATVLLAGLVGMAIYLIINTLESVPRLASQDNRAVSKRLLRGGLIGFLYLEMIDASFSLDGVIGAFAITYDIVLITAGLAIGALFVRAMTIHLLRRGALKKYRYLDHGAHYAIGLLALLLLISIRFNLPQWLTGLSGVTIISFALLDSYWEAKREEPTASVL